MKDIRYSMNMIGSVIGALVVGLIAIFAIVISQGIVQGQNTTGWPSVLSSIVSNIAPVIGIVAIIAMFLIVVRLAGGFGEYIAALESDLYRITRQIRGSLNSEMSMVIAELI